VARLSLLVLCSKAQRNFSERPFFALPTELGAARPVVNSLLCKSSLGSSAMQNQSDPPPYGRDDEGCRLQAAN
jgi:hypothetical protein